VRHSNSSHDTTDVASNQPVSSKLLIPITLQTKTKLQPIFVCNMPKSTGREKEGFVIASEKLLTKTDKDYYIRDGTEI